MEKKQFFSIVYLIFVFNTFHNSHKNVLINLYDQLLYLESRRFLQ